MPHEVIDRVNYLAHKDGQSALLVFEDNLGNPIGEDEILSGLLDERYVEATGVGDYYVQMNVQTEHVPHDAHNDLKNE